MDYFSKLGSYFSSKVVLETSKMTEEIEELDLGEGRIYAPGLALLDDIGIKSARTSGWVMGLNTLWKKFDKKLYNFSFQNGEQLKNTLNYLSLGVINCKFKRTNETPIRFHECNQECRYAVGMAEVINELDTSNRAYIEMYESAKKKIPILR